MATATIEIPPSGDQPQYVGPIQSRVWLWRSEQQGGKPGGSWVEFEDLQNTGDINLVEGQEYDTAEITHHYGPNRRLKDPLFVEYDPYDSSFEWNIVRITIDRVLNEGQPDQSVVNVPIFHGVIGSVEIDRQELKAVYKCFDLGRWIMEHIRNDRGIAEREYYYNGSYAGLQGYKFNDNWVFNDKASGPDDDSALEAEHVFESGNMSEDLYDPSPTPARVGDSDVWELNYYRTTDAETGINIFGSKGGPSSVWTHRAILKYFVEGFINHGMIEDEGGVPPFRSVLPTGFNIRFKILNGDLLDSAILPVDDDNGNAKASQAKKIAKLDLRDKSIRECVHTIIRSAGNLGWRPIVLDNEDSDSGHEIGILIWDKSVKPSKAIEHIALENNSLASPVAKSGMIVDVDSENVEYDPKARVEVDATARCNVLVVMSARRVIGTSFCNWRLDSDGRPSLIPLWEDSYKTELDSLLESTDTDETARNKLEDKRLEHVYMHFGVPKRFNFEDMEPLLEEAAPDRSNCRPLAARRVAVFNSQTGRYEEVVKKDPSTGRELPVRIWNHPRRFNGKIFLRDGWVYGDGTGSGLMPPTPRTFQDGQPKGQGDYMSPLYWLANVDESLNVVRDFTASPPAWTLKGFNERADALSIEAKHRWGNISEDTKSARYDFTGRCKEIQKPEYGTSTRDVAPYDEIEGEIDDTKLRDAKYESWKAIITSQCLEVDDRMVLIIQDNASIARGDPISMTVIRNEEWKYEEAREMLVGFEDDGTPIVLGTDKDNPYIIRNDFEKLEAYARATWRKFRRAKRIGTLTYDFSDFTFEPCGMWVGKCRRKGASWIKIAVDAPVASVTHNLSAQTTVVSTEEAVDVEAQLQAYRGGIEVARR